MRDSKTTSAISRRGFLGAVGDSVVAGSMPGPAAEGAPVTSSKGGPMEAAIRINGQQYRVPFEPAWSLLFLLRDKMGLTGTKPGCERGECGACTVLVGDVPRYACLTLVAELAGKSITTIEGLAHKGVLSPVQQAFVEEDAFQCGYCTSGQVMAAEGLLRANPNPSPGEIREAMSGNLCRCGAYAHIFNAVRRAAELRRRP